MDKSTSGLYPMWNNYLDEIPQERKDIYFREEYVNLYECGSKKAIAYVCVDGENVLVFPFLIQPIIGTVYCDFETAYGYGGAISNTDDSSFLSKAWFNFKINCF